MSKARGENSTSPRFAIVVYQIISGSDTHKWSEIIEGDSLPAELFIATPVVPAKLLLSFQVNWKKGMIVQILMTAKGLESDSWRDMRVLPSVVIVIVKAVLENIKEHHESLINV